MRTAEAWGEEIREESLDLIGRIADRQRGATNSLGFAMRTALGHGVPLPDVAFAAGLTEAAVLRLTDPTGGAS